MSPKIVDKEQRRMELVLVATDLFVEKGFESVSISQIAQAAGIGKGTVYEYFASKEDLICATLITWVERMEKEAKETLNGVDDPVERLKRFAQSSMDILVADERTVKLGIAMFQMLLSREQDLAHHNLIREMFRGFRLTIVDILLDGVSKGVFRPEIARDAEKIAINLTAYLDGIGLHYCMSRNYFDLKEQIDFYFEELLLSLKPSSSG